MARAAALQRDDRIADEQAFTEQLEHFRSDRRPASQKGRAREIAGLAARVLGDEGLGRFSMRLVAERSGMSLAALQYHFPSLADLLRAMIDQRVDAYVDAAKTYLSGLAHDPQAAFATHLDWYIADARSAETSRVTAQFQALACTDRYAAEALDSYMQLYRGSLALFIRRVNPGLPADEAARRGAVIAGMIDGLMIVASEGKPEHPELAGVEDTVRQAVQALVAAPCPPTA